jgi:Helix-turn-helix domain
VGRGGVVRRAYVFRLRPTARQHIALEACVESHRELYNAALQNAGMLGRTARPASTMGISPRS